MDLKKALDNMALFSSKEYKVIQYIMDNPNQFLDMTIRDLSKVTGVSISTIVRVTKKLGTEGYYDFKIEFFKQRKQQNKINYSMEEASITRRDTPYQVIQKITAIEIRISDEVKNEMDLKQIERIVEYILKAEKITLYGSGVNRHLNELFSYSLLRATKNSYVPSTWDDRFLRMRLSNERDVAIILSHRGNNAKYYRLMQGLHQKNIPIILLTGSKESKMATLATEVIYINPGHRFEDMANVIFTTSVSYVYDVLFAYIFNQQYDDIVDNTKEYEELSAYYASIKKENM